MQRRKKEPRYHIVSFRTTEKEYERIKQAAGKRGCSRFVLLTVLEALAPKKRKDSDALREL